MEKIILVVYINTYGLTGDESYRYISDIRENFRTIEEHENILHYVIPIQIGDNAVECINPKLVSEEEYTKASSVLEETILKIEKYFESLKNDN